MQVLSLNGFDWKQLSFTVVDRDLEVWEVGENYTDMTSNCFSDLQDICSRFQNDCLPSGSLNTFLETVTIIGVVLSLVGIVATIITLLLFK